MNARIRALATTTTMTMLAALGVACGGEDAVKPPVVAPVASAAPTAAPPPPSASDPLPAHPETQPTPLFTPPTPVVYTTSNGMTVWLLERHTLPIVAITLAIPTGASSDPKGQAGLALQTAGMLDEGAGKLGAIDFAKAVDQIGAHFSTTATMDSSYAQISVLKRNLAPAMGLLGDAVVRPKMDPKEWKRVHDLWESDLKLRDREPTRVASVVATATLFGTDAPYGHPADGLSTTAPKVTLDAVKKFYGSAWRPDRAIIVAVGDVSRAELDPQLDAAFGSWKKPAGAPLPIVAPPAPEGPRPKIVMVDRPDAPQSVVQVVRAGLPASDEHAPPLTRVNSALGGSFTSRLNQDLREQHGWTYGASSRVSAVRGVGSVTESAQIVTDKTVEATRAMLADIDDFAHQGLTDEEVEKTKLQARADLVEDYEGVEHIASRLARDAALGLAPDYEGKASVVRDQADKHALARLAAKYFDRANATVVIVGPRAKLEAGLTAAGLAPIEMRDADGKPAKGAKAPAAAKTPALAPAAPSAPSAPKKATK